MIKAKSAPKRMKIKKTASDKVIDAVLYFFLSIVLLCVLYPLYLLIIASISSSGAVLRGEVWLLPKDLALEGYQRILSYAKLWNAYKNTIIYTVVGTTVNVALTTTAAFALSKRDLMGRKFFTGMFLFTMFFSGGLIPTYLTIQSYNLLDNMWALILPGAVTCFNLIICRTFFENSIPEELWESAQLDGCSHTRYFFTILLPLSKAILAVLVLYYAMGHWNSYFNAMVYLDDQSKFPLQVVLREILLVNSVDSAVMMDTSALDELYAVMLTMKYSAIIVSSIPLIVLYFAVQKHFAKGIMVGAIKG